MFKINPAELPRSLDPNVLPGTRRDALLVLAAPAMFRFLASIVADERHPCKIDAERVLAMWGVEVANGQDTNAPAK